MADITKNINYNYKTNVQTLTRKHTEFDKRLGKLYTTTQKLTRAIGSKAAYELKGEKVTEKSIGATHRLRGAFGGLNKGMAGLALRFVGYQFILGQVMGMQQKLISFVQESITSYRDFDKAMREVSTILITENLPAIYALTAGVEALSKKYGKAATDLARGTYDILSAAFDADEAMTLLNVATKAAIAGLTDVSVSVDIFTSVLNAYGMTVNQSKEVSDIFFQTVRYGKLVFEDLASAMGFITPIAANAGIEFREIAAVLSTVTRMGLHVDMASRGLALAIQNIVNPTKQAAEAAREYGVDMSAVAIRIKGLRGFILDLNEAMHEHGSIIIPKIIKNMRSLRVIMALAGDVGVAGFTRDLDLMKESAGATEEAMSKMMMAAQTEADITSQSMEYLKRRVGDVWHEFDIGWKKIQVAFAALITGGAPGAAVREIDERILNIKKSYAAMLQVQTRLAGLDPLADILLGTEEKVDISDYVDFEAIEEYLGLEERIREQNLLTADASEKLGDANIALGEEQLKTSTTTKILAIMANMPIKPLVELDQLVKTLGEEFSAAELAGAKLTTRQMALGPEFLYLGSAVDTLSAKINTHKFNLMELQSVMHNLIIDVEATYETMTGTKYVGKLEWKLDIDKQTTALDRFQQHAGMAMKYGAEFTGTYTDVFDKYGNALDDSIIAIFNYNDAVDTAKGIQQEYQDTIDETTKAIRLNNLEIMKLQLAGMMRRRGLTRSEQKSIKQLQISTMQERIDGMEDAIDHELEIEELGVDDKKVLYEEATLIMKEYVDREQFYLWQLGDIRDDELRDLDADIKWKKQLLGKYTTWYGEEQGKLETATLKYIETLEAIDKAGLADEYKAIYRVDIIKEAHDAAIAYNDYITTQLKPFGAKTGKAVAITPTKVPTLPKSPIETFLEEGGVLPRSRIRSFLETGGVRIPTRQRGGIIPTTGLYMGHAGEYVVPRGDSTKARGGDTHIDTVVIQVQNLTDIEDVEKFAAMMATVKQTRMTTPTGQSRYRLR